MLFEKKSIKLKEEQTFGDILKSLKIGSIYYIGDTNGNFYEYTLVPTDKSYVGQLYVANKCKILKCNMNHYIPPQVKLTFTSNANTTVPVYFTKESYDSKTPDDTISLTANQEKTTIYDRKSIYKFTFNKPQAITSAKIEGALLDCNKLFYMCYKLTSLDVSHFDTSKVTDMGDMFNDCNALTSLDLSHLDTSKVTNMHSMFSSCTALTSLNVSHFDTSNVTDMSYMFDTCWYLTSLDVSNFNTSNVTNMSDMFNSCSGLTSLDLSHFDTSNVTNMSDMFYDCGSLTSLDLSHFDTSKVNDMTYMFYDCGSLTSLDVSHFDTSNVTDMNYMFLDCYNLSSLDVSNFNTSKVITMHSMFEGCSKLTTIGPVDTAPGWQHKPTDYENMFKNCPATPKPKWYTAA